MDLKTCTTAKKFWVELPQKPGSFSDVNKSAMRQANKNKIDYYKNLFRFKDELSK